MRKGMIALISAAAMALPTAAAAQFSHGARAPWADAAGYSNRGQCQSAMQQFRNQLRENPEQRDPQNRTLSDGEWNALFDSHWECTRDANGRWYITWEPA